MSLISPDPQDAELDDDPYCPDCENTGVVGGNVDFEELCDCPAGDARAKR